MLNLIVKNRITLFFVFILVSFVAAQVKRQDVPLESLVTLNSLAKMKEPLSFKQQSIVARLMSSQGKQIEDGVLTEFESRCISTNMVLMFGDENAEIFAAISDKAYSGGMDTLSEQDITFMKAIREKYESYLSLTATECSQNETKEPNE